MENFIKAIITVFGVIEWESILIPISSKNMLVDVGVAPSVIRVFGIRGPDQPRHAKRLLKHELRIHN